MTTKDCVRQFYDIVDATMAAIAVTTLAHYLEQGNHRQMGRT